MSHEEQAPTSGARWPWIALGVAMAACLALLLWSGRDTAPFFDEWSWIAGRRGHSLDVLLEGHNGHLSVVPLVLYKGLLQLFGITDYWVFRLVLAGLHLVCAGLIFVYARRRVGDVLGLAAAVLVLFLGAAAQDLLWAFQIGFLFSMVGGVGMLLALDGTTRRSELLAAGLLGLSLASSSLGIVFLAAAIVELLVQRRARRAWIVGVPLALYLLWYAVYGGDDSQGRISNVPLVPQFVVDMASAAVGGLAGLGPEFGLALVAVGAVALGSMLFRVDRLSARTVALLAAPLVFWGLTGLARADLGEPHAGRYIYPGAVLVLLLIVELARGRQASRPLQTVTVAALAAFAVVGGLQPLRTEAETLRTHAADLRAQFGAALAVDGALAPEFVPAPHLAGMVPMASLREIQRDFGAIAMTPSELAAAPGHARQKADETLMAAGVVALSPGEGRRRGDEAVVVSAAGRPLPARRGCARSGGSAAGPLEVTVEPGDQVLIRPAAPAELRVRRHADEYPSGGPTPLPGATSTLMQVPAASGDERPWHVQLSSADRITVCSAAP